MDPKHFWVYPGLRAAGEGQGKERFLILGNYEGHSDNHDGGGCDGDGDVVMMTVMMMKIPIL